MRTADEWADACRILPAGSAEPGPWRTERTPYMRLPMQSARMRFRRIVIVCGAQMGKSELMLNIAGWKLDDDPAPILYVAPTQRLVESVSTSRVMRMLRSVPALWDKLDKSKAGNKVGEKYIAGQRFGFAWAGSATELSSHPAALVLIDERDRMASDVGGEGDPVALAEARTATYPDGKVVIASTPTLEGASPVWSLFLEGTQHRWSWPCPDCSKHFVPELSLLKWPEKATPQAALREAKLTCPNCGSLIGDEHRAAMNAAGEFELAGDPDSDTASFWVSGLCSPWRSFGQAAKAYVEALASGSPERVQAIVNTVLGECYTLEGEAPPWEVVTRLRGDYASGELPADATILKIVAGVDTQGDRLVYVVRAFGYGLESWLLEHGEIYGPTDHQDIWDELAQLLTRKYGERHIDRMLIDSGFRPEMVYGFCRRFMGRAFPSKGHAASDRPIWTSRIDITFAGRTHKAGMMLVHVDTHYTKSMIYHRLDWLPDQAGAFHLPYDATDEYCKQLVSEQRIVRPNGRVDWIRTRTENHYLDAEVLTFAGAHWFGIDRTKKPAPKSDSPAAAQPEQSPQQAGWPDRRQSTGRRNWVTEW